MSGSTTAVIVMPIVIALSLAIWLSLVFWANRHPYVKRHSKHIITEVRGGAFEALEGGRQLMPIPEHRPAVPRQREAGAEETDRAARGATASTRSPETADVPEDQVETHPVSARRSS